MFKAKEHHVFVKTPYSKRYQVKDMLNGVWSKAEGMNRFPKNVYAMRELVREFPQLKDSEHFMETGIKLAEEDNRLLSLRGALDAPGDERLRPYQRVDVQYLKEIGSAGIFNQPRTGKTPTSIVLMKEMNFKSVLVICPASLIWNWGNEFEKWEPRVKTYIVTGTPAKRKKIYQEFVEEEDSKVLIISKDTWRGDHQKLNLTKISFDACFVDEAHFLRNHDSAQSKAVFKVDAGYRYTLTGTPTVTHSKDIFGILKFLKPEKYTSYWRFVERYFIIYEEMWGKNIGEPKPGRVDELQHIIKLSSVQRKRNEVMKWLPNKERIDFHCQMDSKQEKLYKQMLEDFYVELKENSVDAINVLSQLMRLRQLCSDPRLLGFDIVGSKTKALLEWTEDNKEPIVVMSMFTSYLKILKEDLEAKKRKVAMITGEMSNAEKQQSVEDFQAGKVDILLCNIISAGTGFTLDRSETIIFLDKAFNPAENEQAEDRITPVSEERNHKHTIISFAISGTVDERINKILDTKKNLTDYVNEIGVEELLSS